MPGTWFPGQVAAGARVFNNPVVVNGVTTMQKGFASYPPVVATPGTIASGGTAYNTTGYDVMVYLSASTSGTITVAGSALTALGTRTTTPAQVYLASGQSISFAYTGTLTWNWIAV